LHLSIHNDIECEEHANRYAPQTHPAALPAFVNVEARAHGADDVARELPTTKGAANTWLVSAADTPDRRAGRAAEVEGQGNLEPKIPRGEKEEARQGEPVEVVVGVKQRLAQRHVLRFGGAEIGVEAHHCPWVCEDDQDYVYAESKVVAPLLIGGETAGTDEVPHALERVLEACNVRHQFEERTLLLFWCHQLGYGLATELGQVLGHTA